MGKRAANGSASGSAKSDGIGKLGARKAAPTPPSQQRSSTFALGAVAALVVAVSLGAMVVSSRPREDSASGVVPPSAKKNAKEILQTVGSDTFAEQLQDLYKEAAPSKDKPGKPKMPKGLKAGYECALRCQGMTE